MIADSEPGLRLSIIIAAWNGTASLEQCLRSLKDDDRSADTEVIAVTNFDGGGAELLRCQFPYVRHVRLPSNTTVPVLRTTGICRSRGEIIALAEDHCTFGDDWCSELKKAHELPYSVIGGSVENASVRRALDWAVYFYDYGRFMPPNRAGIAPSLSGNNVSYKRAALAEVEAAYQGGFFETFVHAEFKKRGHALYLAPSVIVYHQKSYAARDALVQCYHLARGFAAKRTLNVRRGRRGVFILGALALPVLLPARVALRILRKRRHLAELLRSLPYLVLLMTSWSVGEFCGYLAGEGGSADRWR